MKIKGYIISLLCFLAIIEARAQGQLSTHFDAGSTNVSEGLYIKNALIGQYQLGKMRIEGGTQFDIIRICRTMFAGLSLKASQELSIKDFTFAIKGIFLYTPFSEVVHESNWGLLVNVERSHFHIKLGSNFRKYRITNEAAEKYEITSNRSLHENWNLMYLIRYNLKPNDHHWNVGASITNIDHFLINQETNPMCNLLGKYSINAPFTVYAETWYKSAGSLNISANYFGFFFRTGLIWKIDLVK